VPALFLTYTLYFTLSSCDGSDGFSEIFHTDKPLKSTVGIVVNTPRCSSFRLKLEGSGDIKIKSVGVISEKTGEVNRIGG
jgi:hypothetical protein